MPTDKKGNKITWKQFFKRWRKGIEQEATIKKIIKLGKIKTKDGEGII